MRNCLIALVIVASLGTLGPRPATGALTTRYFVNGAVASSGNGKSWAGAFKTLSEALAVSGAKDIWVAGGTYTPDTRHLFNKRSATFTVKPGDHVFGGFAGTETSLSQRDIAAHETVLSGVLGAVGNSYTVVTVTAGAARVILDGVTVTGGADDRHDAVSAGITANGATLLLTEVAVRGNQINFSLVDEVGAGLHAADSSVTVRDSVFDRNEAHSGEVADIEADGGSTVIERTEFLARRAEASRGHFITQTAGDLTINDVAIAADHGAGVMFRGSSAADVLDGTDLSFDGLGATLLFSGGTGTIRGLFSRTPVDTSQTFGRLAMRVDGGELSLVNATIVGPKPAQQGVNAIDVAAGATLNLESSTLTDWSGAFTNRGTMLVSNSIIWNAGHTSLSGSTTVMKNTIDMINCPNGPGIDVCSNISDADPLLEPLAENGGIGLTRGLQAGSPAIDAADEATCPDTDQRGVSRPVDGDGDGTAVCDIGAHEFEPEHVSFAAASTAVSDSSGSGALVVELDADHEGTVQVDYSVTGGTATAADFELEPGTAVFPAHATTAEVPFVLTNDGVDEPDETIVVTLSNPRGAGLVAPTVHTITISGQARRVEFDPASASVTEGKGKVTVTASLSRPSDTPVTVKFAATGGSAKNGKDFALAPGTLTFPPGILAQSFTIQLKEDLFVEPTETAVITLSAPDGAVLGAKSFTLSIADNEKRGKCGGKNATIVGTGAADTIAGTAGPDVILALGGADTINAAGGNDSVCAGGGNDTVNGGGGNDTLFGNNGNDTLAGGNGNDTQSGGGGSDIVRGAAGNDELRGDGGTDQLDGQGGKDRLAGGPGAGDRCTGGNGADSLLPAHGCEVIVGVP